MRLRDYVNSSWFHIQNNDNSKNITIDLPLEFKVLRYLVKEDTTVRNRVYPDPLEKKETVEYCAYSPDEYFYNTIRECSSGSLLHMQAFKSVMMSRNKPMTRYRDRFI